MLKEKLYLEYQQLYRSYQDRYQKADELVLEVKQLEQKVAAEQAALKSERDMSLQAVKNRKKDLEQQLDSVKKGGTSSSVVKNYSAVRMGEIQTQKEMLQALMQGQAEEAEELQRKKQEATANLEAERDLCQTRLNDLMSGGDRDKPIKTFNEVQLRQQLSQSKKQRLAQVTAQYDDAIEKVQVSLRSVDKNYEEILAQGLACFEENFSLAEKYAQLSAKAEANELPPVIVAALEEPAADVIQRNGLKGGMSAAVFADITSPLDDLREYAPNWLVWLIRGGLPVMAGVGLFLFFKLAGIHMGFVAIAANSVVSILFWILCAAIGFGIGYGILGAVRGKVAAVIGGVAGGVIGFMLAFQVAVMLPRNVTNTVELLVKLILCLLVGLAVNVLVSKTGVGDALVSAGLRLEPIRKVALARQNYMVEATVDNYYTLLKYREVVGQIVEGDRQQQYAAMDGELLKLQQEKASTLESLSGDLDREIEEKVASERAAAKASEKDYDQRKLNLIKMQDECMLELSGYDGKILEEARRYDEKLQKSTQNYEKKIADAKDKLRQLELALTSDQDSLLAKLIEEIECCDAESESIVNSCDKKLTDIVLAYQQKTKQVQSRIVQTREELARELDTLHELFHKIDNETVAFEESQGVLSNYLYLFNENAAQDPIQFAAIKHDKKPIVFLYDIEDSTNVSAALFDFMKAVLAGIYSINARKSFDVTITDPVSKARKFEAQASSKLVLIENDIKKLSVDIHASMRAVAQKGMCVDDYNRQMNEDGEDSVKYFKYKIVEFIVPEEAAAQNTNFFDSDLWGTLGDGRENGFLPIFYISYADWKNTFDEDSRLNSKFILQLKNAIGKSNGAVYKIDAKNITINKI